MGAQGFCFFCSGAQGLYVFVRGPGLGSGRPPPPAFFFDPRPLCVQRSTRVSVPWGAGASPPVGWNAERAPRGRGGMSMARIVTVLRRSPLVALALGALMGTVRVPRADAAGFILNEQSGRALGSAFAGEAAVAMDPTTLFYNPAGLVLVPGTQFASSGFSVWTHFKFHNRGSHLSEEVGGAPLTGGEGNNGGGNALLPTFFLTHRFHQLDDRVSVGIGLGAPFGLETDWARG